MNYRPTMAEINRSHLLHNLSALQSLVDPDCFFSPMVKADAYGHGAVEVTHALESQGVKSVGVALVEEGVELRNAGLKKNQILVFASFNKESMTAAQEFQLTPVISQKNDFDVLKSLSARHKLKVHLKLNTGMNRLSLGESYIEEALHFFKTHPHIQLDGVASHLIQSEDLGLDKSVTLHQMELFQSYVQKFKDFTENFHLLNSGGLLGFAAHRKSLSRFPFWGTRPGIALYGALEKMLNPATHKLQCSLELKPVMSVKTKIIHTHRLKKGETVSYSGTWIASRPSLVGVLPIGYGDGLRRGLSGQWEVQVGESLCPILGRICMDYCVIDLTELDKVNLQEWVYLVGGTRNSLSAMTMAQKLDTISYEVLTGVGKRVPRVYKDHI